MSHFSSDGSDQIFMLFADGKEPTWDPEAKRKLPPRLAGAAFLPRNYFDMQAERLVRCRSLSRSISQLLRHHGEIRPKDQLNIRAAALHFQPSKSAYAPASLNNFA